MNKRGVLIDKKMLAKGCFHYEGPILRFEPNFTDPRKSISKIRSTSYSPSKEYCKILKK